MARAVRRLSAAGHAVYIDAGHARWKPTGETADRLIAAGIADAEGFAVNVANRQSTEDSVAWGRELSDPGQRRAAATATTPPAGPVPLTES